MTVICSSTPSSRDSIMAPKLYDLDRGCWCWLNELVVLTDEGEANDQRGRSSVERRRVNGYGTSSTGGG